MVEKEGLVEIAGAEDVEVSDAVDEVARVVGLRGDEANDDDAVGRMM